MEGKARSRHPRVPNALKRRQNNKGGVETKQNTQKRRVGQWENESEQKCERRTWLWQQQPLPPLLTMALAAKTDRTDTAVEFDWPRSVMQVFALQATETRRGSKEIDDKSGRGERWTNQSRRCTDANWANFLFGSFTDDCVSEREGPESWEPRSNSASLSLQGGGHIWELEQPGLYRR